jgi:hypothetical protein
MVKQMSGLKSWEISIGLFAITSIIIIISGYTPYLGDLSNILTQWGIQIAAFSYLLGLIGLFRSHIIKIQRQAEGWQYSIIMFAFFFITWLSGHFWTSVFDWIVANPLTTLRMAVTSFAGFYQYTVFFRGSRARSFEASLLLLASIIIMFRNAPVGEVIWTGFAPLADWIDKSPAAGAIAAIWIGVGIGAITLWVRSLLGLERAYLGGGVAE